LNKTYTFGNLLLHSFRKQASFVLRWRLTPEHFQYSTYPLYPIHFCLQQNHQPSPATFFCLSSFLLSFLMSCLSLQLFVQLVSMSSVGESAGHSRIEMRLLPQVNFFDYSRRNSENYFTWYIIYKKEPPPFQQIVPLQCFVFITYILELTGIVCSQWYEFNVGFLT